MDKFLTSVALVFGTVCLTLVLVYITDNGIGTKGIVLMSLLVVGQFTLTCGIRSMMRKDSRW
jgi:F0F1-type ATP synthase assembly protein I